GHRRQHALRERIHARGVHAEHRVPLVLADPADAARVARLPGVVDEDVDAAERLQRPRAQLACLVRLRQVTRLGHGDALVALDLVHDLLERLLATARQGDARALGGQEQRGCPADAGAAAGNQRDLAVECLHRLLAEAELGTGQPRGLGAGALDLVDALWRAGRAEVVAG